MQPHNCVEKKVKIAINLQLYEKKNVRYKFAIMRKKKS